MTRPLKNPPENAVERVKALAAEGHSQRGVAMAMGVAAGTFRRWLDEREDLREAYDDGRDTHEFSLANMVYRSATEPGFKGGNITAAFFLLKAKYGWREGERNEAGNRVNITFSLPAAMPLAEFEVIENGRTADRTERLPGPRVAVARGS